MTTVSLFIIFFPLSIVILANAYLVPNNQTMKISIGAMGIGVLGMSIYLGLRAAGIIEAGVPQFIEGYRIALVLAAIGMYSVFGTPLFLEIVKRRGR